MVLLMSDDLYDRIHDGKLDQFRPQETNTRIHPARSIGMLEQSIGEVGWMGAVTVAADGEAFDGSLRIETIATALDGAHPIVVDVDGTRPVIVRRTDIASADTPLARKASVWANRVAEVSEWDKTVLTDWHTEGDIDLSAMWYTEELAGWDVDPVAVDDTPLEFDTVEPDTMGADADGRYPLPIVLTWAENKEWEVIKESLGVKSDKAAFLKLMRGD